jgi:hypothetical protein
MYSLTISEGEFPYAVLDGAGPEITSIHAMTKNHIMAELEGIRTGEDAIEGSLGIELIDGWLFRLYQVTYEYERTRAEGDEIEYQYDDEHLADEQDEYRVIAAQQIKDSGATHVPNIQYILHACKTIKTDDSKAHYQTAISRLRDQFTVSARGISSLPPTK